MNKIIELLKKNGPKLSGDLARLYVKKYGVSNETARKALSRAKSPVRKLSVLKFEKNQVFYYLESQFMSEKYKSSLLDAIKKHSKTNYSYIQAFIAQNGCVSKKILPAFVSSPIGKVKGHKMHSVVLRSLIDTSIIMEYDDDRYSLNPSFCEPINAKRSLGLEIAKKVIINDFNNWAKSTNLVAYGKGKCLFDTPDFGQFQWAYTAPSYVQPLYSRKKSKPGFVVADVIYGKTATKESVQFFLEKIHVLQSFSKISLFLPVLLVDKIDSEALALLKSENVLVAILDNFFSSKYTELLNDLVNVFANTTSIINKNPSLIYDIFQKISQSEGRYNNMAGDMFELLVGSHFAHIGCSGLKAKMDIINSRNGKHREIDWYVVRDGKVIVVECKATRSKIDDKFVLKWLNENIPLIREELLYSNNDTDIEFQLWSVGGFTTEALNLLLKAENNNKKYTIRHYDRQQMIEMAKQTKNRAFEKILHDHFNQANY